VVFSNEISWPEAGSSKPRCASAAERRPVSLNAAHCRLTLFVLGIALFQFGCTKRESIVVVDDWWNVDYAKGGCEMRAHSGNPCFGDPVAEVRDFEARLGTSFAADPSCRGVVLATFNGPVGQSSSAASKAGWQLMLDFALGEGSQYWSMVHRTGDNHYTTGRGNPSEIAHSICAVVNHTGGSIQ
jgi:hypothetical protein